MKILRNLVLMAFPILLMINLYRFVMYQPNYDFRGFSYLHEYFSTFPGLNWTFNLINTLQTTATSFDSIRVESLLDVFDAIGKLFQMLGMAFSIPLMIVVDICRNLWWFVTMFYSPQ